MKTKEELNALKQEVETLNRKLAELTKEELEQVSGGYGGSKGYYCPNRDCSRYACSVNPPENGKCEKCGTPLSYGLIPFIYR